MNIEEEDSSKNVIGRERKRSIVDQEEIWNEISDFWTKSFSEATIHVNLTFLAGLQVATADNILEVACGDGRLSMELVIRKKPEAQLTSMDLCEEFLHTTQSRLAYADKLINTDHRQLLSDISANRFPVNQKYTGKVFFENLNTTITQGNAQDMLDIAPTNSFDVFISPFCFNLIPEPKMMVDEAYRLLQKGGRAGFSMWSTADYGIGMGKSGFFEYLVEACLKEDLIIEMPGQAGWGYLRGKDDALKMLEESGFVDCMAWEHTMINYALSKDLDMLHQFYDMQARELRELLGEKDLKVFDKVLDGVKQTASDYIRKEKKPISLVSVVVIGYKK